MSVTATNTLKALARLRPLLDVFPLLERINYCFAYGSGVFEQSLSSAKSSNDRKTNADSRMIDLVLAVDDAEEWHAANLDRNGNHYSFLRHIGAKRIASLQQHFGAKIFYNTLVRLENGSFIKYGIISTQDLVNDLLDWETLYVSGRLHKPTLELHRNTNHATLAQALKINHESALHAALLLLGDRFTEEQLYLAIAGLSYAGDFRMIFGEDKNKVAKIVKPQVDNFREIYRPILVGSMSNLVELTPAGLQQTCDVEAIQWHLNLLPKTVQHNLW